MVLQVPGERFHAASILLSPGSTVNTQSLPKGGGGEVYAALMPNASPEDRELALLVTAHVLEAMSRDRVSQNEIERRAKFKPGRLSRFMTGERVAVPPSFIVRLARAIGSNPSRMLSAPPDDRRFLEAARRRQFSPKQARNP